ncbi:MAG: hypothetical protein R2822_21415 [Spirosomataceae bacterium]
MLFVSGRFDCDGNRGRSLDPNHIMGHGYAYSVASRIGADFPEAGLYFTTEVLAATKSRTYKNAGKQTLNLKPDVLSILVEVSILQVLLLTNPLKPPPSKNLKISTCRLLLDSFKLIPIFYLYWVFPSSIPLANASKIGNNGVMILPIAK